MRRYRELLAIPGVLGLTAAVTLARLSVSMLSLALLVTTTQVHGYTDAGVLMLVYALTNAAVGPVRGRLADRFPPRLVLLAMTAAHMAAFAVLLLVFAAQAPMTQLVPAGALLGASVPPTGPVVRGLWPTVVRAERLPTAYAFDAALNTITFVAGPIVAGGLLLALPAHAVVAITGALKITGDALVAISPTVRGAPPPQPRPRQRGAGRVFGPLADGRIRLLLVMVALDTFTFGCLELTAVAAASGQGSAGVLTSLLALGAAVSGIGYGARTWPGSPRAQLLALHGAGVLALVAGAASTAGGAVFAVVGAVFMLYGLVNGPVETAKQVLLGEVSPPGQRIEVFSWVFSVMWTGFGLGTVVAGRLADAGRTAPTLLVAAGAQLVVVLVAAVAVAGLRRAHPADT